MSTAALDDRPPPPSRWATAVFTVKVQLLRVRRLIKDMRTDVSRLPRGKIADFPHVVAEHRSGLWSRIDRDELRLELGKVQNLRQAVRSLNGSSVPAGRVFSFWAQIGRATRGRGYVRGRQLQEGCIVPAVGGGLCQLSNALYAVALSAGCEIVERHPHTRVIPGSAASAGKDATVAWNYVDLRFKARQAFLIEAILTRDELVVRLRASEPSKAQGQLVSLLTRPDARKGADSCETCGMADCFRHAQVDRSDVVQRTAFLVDECWPEFATCVMEQRGPLDELSLPLDGTRWRKPRYAWPTDGFREVHAATLDTFIRSWRMRRLATQGPARRMAELAGAEAVARAFARSVSYEVTRLCIAQSLLPFFWRDGHLGGRSFEVLMTRLPMQELQQRLDEAMADHPERALLGDFRADPDLVEWEMEALKAADRIVTPHAAVAALFPGKAVLLDWALPKPRGWTPGPAVLFPGPTAARKGAYELREAARALDFEVVLAGGELEGADFWQGVRTRRIGQSDPWDGVSVVVQPAVVEERPRALLRALAEGVPIVATPACGIPNQPGVFLVAPNDTAELISAIRTAVSLADTSPKSGVGPVS